MHEAQQMQSGKITFHVFEVVASLWLIDLEPAAAKVGDFHCNLADAFFLHGGEMFLIR